MQIELIIKRLLFLLFKLKLNMQGVFSIVASRKKKIQNDICSVDLKVEFYPRKHHFIIIW